jgi:membrane-associated protease RseP (regulator of RpoE activity)
VSDETPSEESPEVAAPAPEAPTADVAPPAEPAPDAAPDAPVAEAPAPAAPVAEAPTADVTTPDAPPVAAADAAPVAPAPVPVAAAAAPAAAPARKGVFVPAWVGAIVLVLVVAALGFGVGRWTADDSDTRPAATANNGGIVPNFPSGNGNNGGQQTPTTPATGTAFLGVATQNATGGVEVLNVGANSPASKAGLKQGDVITAIDDTSITTTTALRAAIQSHQSGDTVTVHYTRDGQAATVKVTLSTQSQ